VLPGDKPAPLPTAAPNTYPQWNPMTAYVAGARVQAGLVPYQAKWWTQGQRPGAVVAGGSPWVLVYPS
jgi:chitinase